MSQVASNLLSQNRFWEIISHSLDGTNGVGLTTDRQEKLLEQQLEQLTHDEFAGFIGHFYNYYHNAYRNDLWAVAYVVMGGCSDDCFMDFRKWLVMRGKSVYHAALQNPDSLCSEFDKIPSGDIPLWEYYFEKQFDRRFGEGAHDKAYALFDFSPGELIDTQNKWSDDDEASIKKLCPSVYSEYWDNDRF